MIRQCFLTGEHIFFAEERAKRPHNFKKINVSETPKELCPFCPENESMTPGVIYSACNNLIRIVPNKYPFISPNDSEYFGIHDVLIDTDKHSERLCMFTEEHFGEIIKAVIARVTELEKIDKIKYVQVFKNQGIDAGASQSHSHWQIAALSNIPYKFTLSMNAEKKYFLKNGKCYFCSLDSEDRLVDENNCFKAFVPYDAKFPYEMHIMPKRHIHNIKYFDNEEAEMFGSILRSCIRRLTSLYDNISYNICFYNSPKSSEFEKYHHFYAQIIPRIGHMAGFEFSTGCFINSVLPENAAEILRNVNI